MKARDTVTGRDLRRSNPEERLAPGKKLVVIKKGGKLFEMRRVDQGKRNMLAELNQIIKEIPIARDASSRQLSSIVLEDRE
ncbi:MAG: hypothetical protein ACYDH9_24010 [Limisphaerales bacterium]